MPLQTTAARLGIVALALGALTAAAAVAGVRLALISYPLGYRVMTAATLLGLVALAAALVWAFCAFRRNRGDGKRLGLAALAGSLLLLYPPLSAWAHRLAALPIHDISTDTDDPPAFVALLRQRGPGDNPPGFDGSRRIPYQGEMRSVDYALHKEYPDLLHPDMKFAVGSKNPADTYFWRAFEAAKNAGWTVVDQDPRQGRIEATHASFWFGRVSDIVIRVKPAGMGARTDIRVQSRSDARDDGEGAALIKRFKAVRAG